MHSGDYFILFVTKNAPELLVTLIHYPELAVHGRCCRWCFFSRLTQLGVIPAYCWMVNRGSNLNLKMFHSLFFFRFGLLTLFYEDFLNFGCRFKITSFFAWHRLIESLSFVLVILVHLISDQLFIKELFRIGVVLERTGYVLRYTKLWPFSRLSGNIGATAGKDQVSLKPCRAESCTMIANSSIFWLEIEWKNLTLAVDFI